MAEDKIPNLIGVNNLSWFFDNLLTKLLIRGNKMLEVDHLELQEKNQEPITRPKLKRLILEYLQKRSRQDLIAEVLTEKDEDLESNGNE